MNSRYRVIMLAKNSSDTATITVMAKDEDEAMELVDEMIDNDVNYNHFKTGWKISEAELV